MARIFRHPDVEDYFHVLDLRQDSTTLASTATKLYEAGQVFILDDYRLQFDAGFFADLEFDHQTTKKFKSINFLNYARQLSFRMGAVGPYQEMLDATFGGDKKRMRRFADQVEAINSQVDAMVKRLFPTYCVTKPSVTYRLNETINENLHFDVYNEDLPQHHLRLFVNLDTVPRIWHTGHGLEHVLKTSLRELDGSFIRNATPGRICHDLNFKVFKGFPEAGREGQPKHIVFFEPGEMWVVDSRKVSHQIFFGRKALSIEHAISEDSMADRSTHYFRMVERCRQKYLESVAQPA